jgi:Reverse transcriptase (RNA-dependent DNA polymerase)
LIDECIYHKFSWSKFVFLILYVDDILLASNDKNILHETNKFLFKHFDIKDIGKVSYELGLKIHRDRNKGILGLSQQAYIDKVLNVGFCNAQISLVLKLRKDRRTKILLLLKLGIKVCRIITERYKHLILYKRR